MIPDRPRAIILSEKEKAGGAYSSLNLQKALEGLHLDGLVILKGVVDSAHIDAISTEMCGQVDSLTANPQISYNHYVSSNFLQRPPVTNSTLLHKDVYFNPFLLQVANSYLGHQPIWNWLTANTAVSNTSGLRQQPHKDSNFAHPQYPYYFIANIPLCDFSVQTGATEFWLGSHATTSSDEQMLGTDPEKVGPYYRLGEPIPYIKEEVLDSRRAIRPPVQPEAEIGDIMIRDLRIWHAGMPNESTKHRIMLGLGYQSPIYPNYKMKCHLPAAHKDFFLGHAQDQVQVRAEFYGDAEFDATTNDKEFDLSPQHLFE